ncbi:HlyD family type I secretion periplasmic adaptor subunit [Rhizobium rhizoryzae]|uniref:HlyD family type I secretion periplasmic adaptor subunit n=1 Tax=Rhizobium rhizoryzae TaxID=451876 RepID=UPI0028B130BC|nr:HlyD family type I secretion periplasmic adaptor subunit [Rhizobium rhizoryzae]
MTSTIPANESAVSPTLRITVWLLLLLFAAILGGGILAKTEVVARGAGKLVPVARVQIVQPLADGKVVELAVAEGQSVAKGDILVRLDPTSAQSDIQRIQAEIDQQSLDANVAAAVFSSLMARDPAAAGFMEYGIAEFRGRRGINPDGSAVGEDLVRAALASLRDQVLQLDAKQKQLEFQQQAQGARVDKAKVDRDIVSQNLATAESLMSQGILSRTAHLERLRELRSIDGDAEVSARELSALVASGEATRRQRISIISDNLATQSRRLREAEIALSSSHASLRAAEDKLRNLTLRSPVHGRIENLSIHTIGGFVSAGASLMTVVPTNGCLEIEAFFDNRDIGFLRNGQSAYAKLDAFPSERFGVIPATVINLGADARQSGGTNWVYAVRLKANRSHMLVDEAPVPFSPGMTATVDVVTSERRLISYFFEPITKAFQNGLKER